MDSRVGFCKRSKAYLYVIILQIGYAGMNIISKIALTDGSSPHVLVVYRHIVAAIVLAPIALIFERKVRPKMTISIFIKILLLALLEPTIDQNLYYIGMKLTTASFTAAMSNMLPAFAFLMAWVLRLEKVNIKEMHSWSKILGTIVTVGGAFIMTLVKGPVLSWIRGHDQHHPSATASSSTSTQDTIKGALLIAMGCFCWAGFFNLQAITMKTYPAAISLATFICLAGSIESAIFAIPMERKNPSSWNIGFDSKLLASVYSGVICSALAFSLQGEIMKSKGPVFVTAFSPLSMVMVTTVSSLFLSEILYLGRLIGAIVIVSGLYLVLWGKSKDQTSKLLNRIENEIEFSNTIMATAAVENGNSTNQGFVTIDLARVQNHR